MNNKKRRTALSYALSFFLTLSVFGILLYAEASTGILNAKNIRKGLVKSKYIENVQEKMLEELTVLLNERDMDPEIAGKAVNYDEIYLDISSFISQVVSGNQVTASSSEFEASLSAAIETYMTENGVAASPKLTEGIDELVAAASSRYSQYVTPYFVVQMYSFMNEMKPHVRLAGRICIGIALIISILLCLLFHYKHHAVNYMAYSVAAAVLLNKAGLMLLARKDITGSLGIGPQYYIDYIDRLIEISFRECKMVTMIGIAGVVLLLFVRRTLRNMSKNQ